MRTLIMTLGFLFFLGIGCFVRAGSFSGTVTDGSGAPIGNVVVILTDQFGQTQQMLTLANGAYLFSELPEGWYTVHILTPSGYILVFPLCGFYFHYVPQEGQVYGHFGVEAQSSGVVIEYGQPGGGSGPPRGISRMRFEDTQFSLSLYLSNMVTLLPPYPKSITITGYWLVPGKGKVTVAGLSGSGAGSYHDDDIQVSFSSLPQNRMVIYLTHDQWPYFSLNGEVVQLYFDVLSGMNQILAMGGRLVFCIEAVTIENQGTQISGTAVPYLGIAQ